MAGANESLLGNVINKFSGVGKAIESLAESLGVYINLSFIMLIGCVITLAIYIPLMPFLIRLAAYA
jgi:hypothetical protein